jgi:hypothetical protein
LYPSQCVSHKKLHNNSNKESTSKQERQRSKSLIALNVYMNTLCCGLNLKHESICILPPLMSLVKKMNIIIIRINSNINDLIFNNKAREMIHSYRIALIYMLMCNLSVCLVQLICNIIFLPPILSGFQVFIRIFYNVD